MKVFITKTEEPECLVLQMVRIFLCVGIIDHISVMGTICRLTDIETMRILLCVFNHRICHYSSSLCEARAYCLKVEHFLFVGVILYIFP